MRRNQGGQVLAMVAAAIIPILGLVGGGVDMSRLYLTKSRLQLACDAGALAGRKQMGSGAWSASSNKANAVAEQLFTANWGSTNPYGTANSSKAYSESGGKVTGTASVDVPMTIMRIFGQTTKTISVTCDAEMRIPNTDVMFVLDTTGSMGDTNVGDTDTKMNGLKKAVKCFYEALMKVDTTADCGSTPSGGNGSTVQLRFGFVPYSVNVNVGKLLHNDWIADTWTYQSRSPQFTSSTSNVTTTGTASLINTVNGNWGNWSGWSSADYSGYCDGRSDDGTTTGNEGSAYSQSSTTSGNTTTVTWYTDTVVTERDYSTESQNNGFFGWGRKCEVDVRSRSYTIRKQYQRTDTTTAVTTQTFNNWLYAPTAIDVSGLKAGGYDWNNSISLPLGTNGTATDVAWAGCIEERQTVRATSYSPIPSNAYDLDIDTVPSNAATQWGPLLPNAVWGRYDSSGNWTTSNRTTSSDLSRNNDAYCPTEAKKLQTWSTASTFETYVNSLTPNGNTYHDIGLIWGARLMSPTGLFATENAFTPNGGTIERHLIFMTDGDTVTATDNYSAYGVAWWDRRQTSASSAPSSSDLTNQVNLRFSAMCTAIKNRNITLWVISFGSGVNTDSIARLQACASTGRFYNAANSTDLINQFKAIASEISQLRLTN
ncbi:MAG: TadE/TadG family type IV pilus assembly protein [Sphingobium sp.]